MLKERIAKLERELDEARISLTELGGQRKGKPSSTFTFTIRYPSRRQLRDGQGKAREPPKLKHIRDKELLDSFSTPGTVTLASGMKLYRGTNILGKGSFGFVWPLYPEEPKEGVTLTPAHVLKVMTADSAQHEQEIWSKLATDSFTQLNPFFTRYFGQPTILKPDFARNSNFVGLIFEYVGEPLPRFSLQSEPPAHFAATLAFQLCWAVISFHSALHIFHNDLHASNICIQHMPARYYFWRRDIAWVFDCDYKLTIIDVGSASICTLTQTHTYFSDICKGLRSLVNTLQRLNAPGFNELAELLASFKDNAIKSRVLIEQPAFYRLRFLLPASRLFSLAAFTSRNIQPSAYGCLISPKPADPPGKKCCTYCCIFDVRPGKVYCEMNACTRKHKQSKKPTDLPDKKRCTYCHIFDARPGKVYCEMNACTRKHRQSKNV